MKREHDIKQKHLRFHLRWLRRSRYIEKHPDRVTLRDIVRLRCNVSIRQGKVKMSVRYVTKGRARMIRESMSDCVVNFVEDKWSRCPEWAE